MEFFVVDVIGLSVHFEQLCQLSLVVNIAELAPHDAVQQGGNRVGDDANEEHEEDDDEASVVPNGQAVARTETLRNDLTEAHDGEGGDEGTHQARGHRPQKDGQDGVDGRVAKQQCAQQEVSFGAQGEQSSGVDLLLFGSGTVDDFKSLDVERHEAEVEAREESREGEKSEDNDYFVRMDRWSRVA